MFLRFMVVVALTLPVFAVGCSPAAPTSDDGKLLARQVVPPVPPKEPDLTTPIKAVETYTDWISYVYRVSNSDIATHTFTGNEEVNVNSYVQYNLLEKRGIEQQLQQSKYRILSSTPTSATVVGSEYWLYRYFALDETEYLTGPLEASYEITYTVLKQPDGRWLVDEVRAKEVSRTVAPE